jgi:aspartate aminotransferase
MSFPIAKRCSTLQASPTLALNAKAQELKASGKTVYNFAVGECDAGTPKVIVDAAIKALGEGKTRYSSPGGSLPLRQAIQRKLMRENHLTWSENDLVVGMGAKELLFHLCLGLLDPGDEVIVPAPYWVSYAEQIQLAGASAKIIPSERTLQNQGFALNCADIEAVATTKTKALILNFPNNPCGAVATESQLRELANYLLDKPWWIISDEIYEYLVYGQKHLSLLNVEPRLKDRFIYVNGLSKGFFMTGWRVGYLAAPSPVAKTVRSLQGHSSTCIPPFIEAAAIVALDGGKDLIKNEIAALDRRRQLTIKWAQEQSHIKYTEPQGAFYLFLDLSHPLRTLSSMTFAENLLEKYQVAVVPGEAFGAPRHIRLSFAVGEADLLEGLRRISLAIAELK